MGYIFVPAFLFGNHNLGMIGRTSKLDLIISKGDLSDFLKSPGINFLI